MEFIWLIFCVSEYTKSAKKQMHFMFSFPMCRRNTYIFKVTSTWFLVHFSGYVKVSNFITAANLIGYNIIMYHLFPRWYGSSTEGPRDTLIFHGLEGSSACSFTENVFCRAEQKPPMSPCKHFWPCVCGRHFFSCLANIFIFIVLSLNFPKLWHI